MYFFCIMSNFIIKNKFNNEAEIDIFGDIGSDFFGEGITFESIKNQLSTINAQTIKLNISSLGGDVNDALVIYNLLKTNPAKVEANIMGFTASSATIIAMSADVVKMDKNASFLIHNAWTGAVGNQHDLRELADDLERIDNKLISIYKDKTGMRKDTLANLMKEERWLDAEEAKSMGFIDEVYKPMKAAASYNKQIEIINNSKQLPKIDNMDKKEFNVEEFKSNIFSEMKNFVTELFNKENEKKPEVNTSEVIEKVENNFSNRVDDVVNAYEEKIAEINNSKEVEVSELKNKITELENEIAGLKVTPTKVENVVTDPNPTEPEVVEESENVKAMKSILANLTPSEKLMMNKKK